MYQSGNLGLAEGLALVFVITIPRIFLAAPVILVVEGKGLAWFADMLAGMTSLAMALLLWFVFSRVKGDFVTVCEKLTGKAGSWLLSLYLAAWFIANAVQLLRQFAENTLLTALPAIEFSFILTFYALVVALIVFAGLEGIARAAYVILPFGVLGMLLVLLLLTPFYDIYCLAPWQGSGVGNQFVIGAKYAGFNMGAFLFAVVAPAFREANAMKMAVVYGVSGCVSLKALAIMAYVMAFDLTMGQEKILPFFEITRLVYLSIYLQHIEALFIILWAITGVLSIAASLYMGIYILVRLFKLPALRPLVPLSAVLLNELAMLTPDIADVIQVDIVFIKIFSAVGLYGIPILLLAALFLKSAKRRQKLWRGG